MFLEYFSLTAKFICLNFDMNQKCFTCSKHSNLENGQPLFFKMSFFHQMSTTKGLEIYFYNQFKHNWFKHLTLKIMEFENVAFNKTCSYLCGRGHECVIHVI
jgi:hypothetical protein